MKRWAKNQTGFTVVELLIVIVVIAILAIIIVVTYNGVQNRAHDASVQNDLSNFVKKVQMYEASNGKFPRGTVELTTLDIKLSKDSYSRGMYNGASYYNFVYCWPNSSLDPEKFAVIAESKSGRTFTYSGGVFTDSDTPLATSSTSACSAAGVPLASGNDRDWLYHADAWMSYVK
ncbi:hypothetical protein B7Y94_03235 [Candidatus Saccharibacteria bacterium 32-49-12]|nr:MAG: hypothetical protein B7Y94_03235 [Candidatus Saccharibacteria bacterium 32-49-12]